METRANFVLIGAFTLFGILGSLGFFLWLAKVEVDRQYAYYDIIFESVSGLGEAGSVRYNGLPVGQVVGLALDRTDPGKVRVRIEIDAGTPVRTDTIVTLEMQGVTGVSYVSLSGGSPGAGRLRAAPGEDVPVIVAARSAVQSLFEGAPELLSKAIGLLEDVNAIMSPENRAAVGGILANLESASGKLDTALDNFSTFSAELSQASARIAAFTDRLDEVADAATTMLNTADETLRTARTAVEMTRPMIGEATGALAGARQTFESANRLISDELPGLIDRVEATASAIETVVADVGARAGSVVGKIDRLSDAAIARLTEAEATIAKLDIALDAATATLASVDEASRGVNALVTGEGAALVAGARQTFESANRLISGELPGLIDQVEATASAIETVVADVGARAGSVVGKIDRLSDVAIARLTEAEATIAKLDIALDAAAATMTSVDGAARGVNALVSGEGAALVTEARRAVASANEAISAANRVIVEDLPGIVAEIRSATSTVNAVVARVGEDLSGVSGMLGGIAANADTAILSATETFRRANATLTAIAATMVIADGTLNTARETFAGVNRLLDEDIDAIVADIKNSVASLNTALARVSGDLPEITAEMIRMLARTTKFIDNLDRIVVGNADQIEVFMRAGLPQFVRFVKEGSKLVASLQRLTAKIERDPARFLLGTQAPEFRR